MKRKLLFGTLWLVPAYFVGLFGGIGLIPLVDGNAHDSSVEAAMTGAFVIGPLMAIAGFIAGVCLTKPTAATRRSDR